MDDKQTIADVRDRMPRIAAALSQVAQETWTATDYNPDHYASVPALRCEADGCRLAVWVNVQGKTPSIEVRTDAPKYTNGQTYYIRDREKVPAINVGLQKSDEQIARDIYRRIVTAWQPVYQVARADIEQHAGACYTARFDAELVAKALDGVIHMPHGDDKPRTDYSIRLKPRHGLRAYDDVKVSDRTVTFSLTLPLAEAIELLQSMPIIEKES